MQKAASSGSWAPHLGQYKVTAPRYRDLLAWFGNLFSYVWIIL
jgi:hypothetical protein